MSRTTSTTNVRTFVRNNMRNRLIQNSLNLLSDLISVGLSPIFSILSTLRPLRSLALQLLCFLLHLICIEEWRPYILLSATSTASIILILIIFVVLMLNRFHEWLHITILLLSFHPFTSRLRILCQGLLFFP
jgi:hypothetical protein